MPPILCLWSNLAHNLTADLQLRWVYSTIAFCPQLISTEEDIDLIVSTFVATLDDAVTWTRCEDQIGAKRCPSAEQRHSMTNAL
jgi:hypothetical protein